jgi:hypothetical protein
MSRSGRSDPPDRTKPVDRHRVDDEQRLAGLLDGLDVQAQALAALDDVRAAEELAVAEIARTTWADRVRAVAASNALIEVELPDGRVVTAAVDAVFADGLSLVGSPEVGEWVIRADAVQSLRGVGMRTQPASRIEQRLTLASVLRDWAEQMSAVRCVSARGTREGTIVRVGSDHIDLAEHVDGEPSSTQRVRVLPMMSVWALHRW